MTNEPRIAVGVEERSAVHELARLAFGREGSPTLVLAERLGSARRAQATPWLLTEDGQPVSSLLVYPLVFRTPTGEVLPGYGLGAVVTHPDHRRRGHAARLCRHVAAHADAQGPAIGLLFSGIGERYYEALGYRATHAWDVVCDDLAALAEGGERREWRALDPRSSWRDLARVYDRARAGTLHLVRFENAWRRTLELADDSAWLGLYEGQHPVGYARFRTASEHFALVELALLAPQDAAPALRGLARLAEEAGCRTLGTWLAPIPGLEGHFTDRTPTKNHPMLRGIDPALRLSVSSADYF